MSKKIKPKFFLNQDNQLVIKNLQAKMPTLVGGKFKMLNNNLVYTLNKPKSWRRKYGISKKNVFSGTWRLDPEHNLILDLAETKDYAKTSLVLKGKITQCQSEFLKFKLKSKGDKNKQDVSFLRLDGLWHSDRFNRINFVVKRHNNPETHIFKNIWQLNKQQRIVYSYEKLGLKRKNKVKQNIIFDGFWQISSSNKLKYILTKGKDSVFDFRVQVESPNIYPKKGAIKYRLGIGAGVFRREKVISLYGHWNFSRKLGLSFTIDYEAGQLKRNYLGAKVKITKNKDLVFSLRDAQDRPLGLALTFNHNLLAKKDLEHFLQAKKTGRDLYFGSGITLRF